MTDKTTKTEYTYFPIYRISHDAGTGHYSSTFAFARYDWSTRAHTGGPDGQFVVGYSHDEGHIGTLRAPEGARLAEVEGYGTVLELPGGFTYTAAEALHFARSDVGKRQTGLSLIGQ